jgi:hypothetical protein
VYQHHPERFRQHALAVTIIAPCFHAPHDLI